MHSNSNTQSNSYSISNSEIKNKGFVFLDQLFKENGWHMTKNEMDLLFHFSFHRKKKMISGFFLF